MPAFDVVRVAVLAAGVLDALQGVDREFGKRGGPWSQGIWGETGEFMLRISGHLPPRIFMV